MSSLNRATLKRLRARGVNALVLRREGLSAKQQLRLTGLAARSNLMAFLPLVESRPSSWASVLSAAERCRVLKRARPRSRCAVLARTIKSARRLAQQEAVDLVVVRAKSTRSLRSLKALPGRVLAVRALRPTPRFRSVWRASIRLARSGRFDLAVAPSGREKRSTLIRYAGLLRRLTRVTDVRPPTTPKRLEVTSRGTATISLDWQSSRDNKSVVGYGVYRGGVLAATVPTPGYTLSGLECGTGYAFAVDAVDAAGNRSMKSALAASTHACSGKVYSMTPTDGAKVAGTLDWEAGVTNAEVSEIDFLIDGVHHWTERNAPYVRTWDTTDDVNGPHTLTLVASLSDGDTLTSSIDVTVDNGWGDATAPTTPSGLAVAGSTETSVLLTWTASTDDVGVAGYRVYRDGALVASTSTTSRTVSSLACGTSYTFAVAAYDAAGNTSGQASRTASTSACPEDTSAPTTPSGLVATGSTATSVSLSWSASSDDVGVTGYRVYRDGALVASTSTTSRTVSSLACGTSYTFAVAAYDAAGNTSGQASRTASTSACPEDTSAPTTPSGLAVTGSTATSVSLSWTASSDDVGVVHYGLYRNGTAVGTAAGSTYTFGGLACSLSYTLAVDAVDAAGNRSQKASVMTSTSACEPAEETDTVYVSTGGSDSSACTNSAPCRSFDRAYRVADPGDVVEVAGGTYSGQTINVDSSKTSSDEVVFRPAAGASVSLSSPLVVYGRHLELRDMRFRYEIQAGASDVTLRDIVAPGGIKITSNGTAFPNDISIIGGEIGPGVDSHPQIGSNGTSTTASPTNILFDGVYFHDFTVSSGSSAHVECLQVWAVDGLTIRNSRFENCYHFDVFLQKLPGGAAPTPSNILIENNFLDCCGGGFYSIRLSDTHGESWRDVIVRNNSTNKAMNVGPDVSYSNVKFLSNIAPKLDGAPKAGVTVDYNVWYAGTAIGPNDQVAPHGYRDAANLDFHLSAGAAAVDRGHPDDHPPADIDDDVRPLGAAPDVGADETDSTADSSAPSTPTGFGVTGSGETSVSVAWNASSDDVGVAGYGLYRNGTRVANTGSRTHTFGGLACARSYTFAVDAVDAAGNRSGKASVSASTSACPSSEGGVAVYVSTSGADANDCSQATPCKTFDRAYRVADPGDVVEVAGGTYGSQTIDSDSSKTSSADVVFRPAPGASVTIAEDLNFQSGSHITVEDMRILDRPYLYPGTQDVTLRGIVASKFFLRCAHDVTIVDSEFTDRNATGVPTVSAAGSVTIPSSGRDLCPSSSTPSSNVVIDDVYFHEIWRPEGDSSSHRECLHVMGVDGLVISNSHFHECLGNTAAISFNIHHGSYVAGALVENNFFWKTYDDTTGSGASRRGTGSGTHIHLSDDPSNGCEITIRFNTMTLGGLGVTTFCPERGGGVIVDSNIFEKAIPCSGSGSPPNQAETYTWRHNVAEEGSWGSPCNSNGTNRVAHVSYTSLSSGDLRLASGAFPVDKGNPTSPPATDNMGTARPLGAAPDAGAHERS
ncbi:MAG: fibronectin type III domain-containing protein [Gaiellaceae bacterium]